MKEDEFSQEIKSKMNQIGIVLDEEQVSLFYQYMNLIIEWNEKINLTAIIEPKEIILKHFVDSAMILKEIKAEDRLLDVGTGAGFPGIPLKILRRELNVTLLDSLNKRVVFLEEVIQKLNLKGIKALHSRAEDLARMKEHREQYTVVTSRAVAALNVLLEYMIPFTKIGGRCICMKGCEIEEEVSNSKKALNRLGGEFEKIDAAVLPESDMKRNTILVKKVKETPKGYPRKAGKPSKEPIE